MLNNDLFKLTKLVTRDNVINADIALNAGHAIFKGHFPGQPVLPGVCMMEIIKEVLEASIESSSRLLKASELKFLSVVSPEHTSVLQAHVKMAAMDGLIKVDARLMNDATVVFKLKGIFERSFPDAKTATVQVS